MWTDIGGDQQHCDRHGVTFRKSQVCGACVTDPGPPPEQVKAETADPASTADEQWCREQRDMLIAIAVDSSALAAAPARTPRAPAEPGKDGDERDGWFFWRGHWRPLDVAIVASPATVAKLADTALKFHRAAVDERRRRGEHDHERWLVKQCRELARGRGVSN